MPTRWISVCTAAPRSSVSAIVGTGLGGGIVHQGRVIKGATGAAGELGHVHIPMAGLLEPDQPVPRCNCGFSGDAEGVASLTGIELNLLPYWLSRYPDHGGSLPLSEAARSVRAYGEAGDPMATRIFEQQAVALGRLFTIATNFLDPDAYFIGGGVVETGNAFKTWFLQKVRDNTTLREEAAAAAEFVLVPELDMAGTGSRNGRTRRSPGSLNRLRGREFLERLGTFDRLQPVMADRRVQLGRGCAPHESLAILRSPRDVPRWSPRSRDPDRRP